MRDRRVGDISAVAGASGSESKSNNNSRSVREYERNQTPVTVVLEEVKDKEKEKEKAEPRKIPVPVRPRESKKLRWFFAALDKNKFVDKQIEHIYKCYSHRFTVHQTFVINLIVAALCITNIVNSVFKLLYDMPCWAVCGPSDMSAYTRHVVNTASISVALLSSVCVMFAVHFYGDKMHDKELRLPKLLTVAEVLLIVFTCTLFTNRLTVNMSAGLLECCVFVFMIYTVLPISFGWKIALGVFLPLMQLVCCIPYLGTSAQFSYAAVLVANLLTAVLSNFVGYFTTQLLEIQHRKVFLDTKLLIESEAELTKEVKKQERLLLTILPDHVLEEMRADLGELKSAVMLPSCEQEFEKMPLKPGRKTYLHVHEPVTMMYADICNFTGLSANLTAQQLVFVLNDLFAYFDQLANKHNCLRIKILGDCYYCVSGIPNARSDHADCCVKMALSVVQATRQIAASTQTSLSMRVGIHTGRVFAGVLGMKKWHYDIFGNDVHIAVAVQAAGEPGKVHVTDKTRQCLTGDYEIEPYCVKGQQNVVLDQPTYFVYARNQEDVCRQDERFRKRKSSSPFCIKAAFETKSFAAMQKKYCKSRYDITFKDQDIENQYRQAKGTYVKSRFAYVLIVNALIALAEMVLPFSSLTSVPMFILTSTIISSFVLITSFFKENKVKLEAMKVAATALTSLCLFATATSPMTSYFLLQDLWNSVLQELAHSSSQSAKAMAYYLGTYEETAAELYHYNSHITNRSICPNVTIEQYYDHLFFQFFRANIEYGNVCLTLAVLSMTIFARARSTYIIVVAFFMCFGYALYLGLSLGSYAVHDNDDRKRYGSYTVFIMGVMVVVFLVVRLHIRSAELFNRVEFVVQLQAKQERDAVELRRKYTERLLSNILPKHVAEYFLRKMQQPEKRNMYSPMNTPLGSRRSSRPFVFEEDMYYEDCPYAAVLFAKICNIPNFDCDVSGDCCSQQTIENLKLLNEVIVEFDELLNKVQFRGIEKIKNTGTNYMVVSGLHNGSACRNSNAVDRMAKNVLELVNFAFTMEDRISAINQLINLNLRLQVGIHCGAIVAGVIGSKKPHYDVWGNVVNVASRMESTSNPGKIQVTDQVAKILIAHGHQISNRGSIKVKGVGNMETFFLKRPQDNRLNDINRIDANEAIDPRLPVLNLEDRS